MRRALAVMLSLAVVASSPTPAATAVLGLTELTSTSPWFIAGDSNPWQYVAAAGWLEYGHNTVGAGNAGGWYSAATGRFTAPYTGIYLCVSTQYIHASQSGIGYIHFDIGVNGSPVSGGGRTYGSYQLNGMTTSEGTYSSSTKVTRLLSLNAGDYASVWAYHSTAGSYRYGNYSYFACTMMI